MPSLSHSNLDLPWGDMLFPLALAFLSIHWAGEIQGSPLGNQVLCLVKQEVTKIGSKADLTILCSAEDVWDAARKELDLRLGRSHNLGSGNRPSGSCER